MMLPNRDGGGTGCQKWQRRVHNSYLGPIILLVPGGVSLEGAVFVRLNQPGCSPLKSSAVCQLEGTVSTLVQWVVGLPNSS